MHFQDYKKKMKIINCRSKFIMHLLLAMKFNLFYYVLALSIR